VWHLVAETRHPEAVPDRLKVVPVVYVLGNHEVALFARTYTTHSSTPTNVPSCLSLRHGK